MRSAGGCRFRKVPSVLTISKDALVELCSCLTVFIRYRLGSSGWKLMRWWRRKAHCWLMKLLLSLLKASSFFECFWIFISYLESSWNSLEIWYLSWQSSEAWSTIDGVLLFKSTILEMLRMLWSLLWYLQLMAFFCFSDSYQSFGDSKTHSAEGILILRTALVLQQIKGILRWDWSLSPLQAWILWGYYPSMKLVFRSFNPSVKLIFWNFYPSMKLIFRSFDPPVKSVFRSFDPPVSWFSEASILLLRYVSYYPPALTFSFASRPSICCFWWSCSSRMLRLRK